MAGVTADGFTKKTLAECREELEDRYKEEFGNEIDLSAASPWGQMIGIHAEREAELWNLAEAVYLSQYPDSASGAPLIDVCAITGTVPLEATPSTVTVTATGTNGTALTAGRVFQVQNSGARFVTIDAATLVTLTSWAITTAYVVGDRRTNSGRCYICITSGTSAGSGGPTTTSADITDGTVHWKYLGQGAAAVDVECESEDTGPKVANAGTLNVIVTAVSGLSTIVNLADADLGTDLETDAELRERRENELRLAGSSSVESLRQDLLQVDDVEAAIVYENDTDSVDGDGRPAHSLEAVVLGDADEQDILDCIWAGKPAGIATHGSESGTVTDSMGIDHTIEFSFADEELVWLTVNVEKEDDATMTDGEIGQAVKDAIVAWATRTRFPMGKDLVTAKIDSAIWGDVTLAEQLYDVTSITSVLKDTTPGGGEYNATNKTISQRQVAAFDTSRITVNVS